MPGKKAQDWSYLTPIRALYQQSGNIGDPTGIPDAAIVDTTVEISGAPTGRARQQTLVVFVTLAGGSLDIGNLRLTVWIDSLWESEICEHPPTSSSSSNEGCPPLPDKGSITESERWAAIEHALINDVGTEIDDRSVAFTFPWMPAGRYKIGVSNGLTGNAVISEQHTE